MAQITISDLEAKALRSAIQWARQLEAEGKLELYDYQKEAFDRLNGVLILTEKVE